MDQLEHITSVEGLACLLGLALQDPVIVYMMEWLLSSPLPPSPKAETSCPPVIKD